MPGLRHVERTGPYIHNGGMATLEQVVEFYARGGNFINDATQVTRVFPQPNLQLDQHNRSDLITFLKMLTDERVRYEKAPSDHPEVRRPHGHVGDSVRMRGGHPRSRSLAKDEYLTIQVVGADGRSTPSLPLEEALAP